jgi:RNA polymerase sigma-70 factor (ECF subfamily)
MVLDEERVIDGCKVRDGRSQALLYKEYAPMLFGIALRYTPSDDDAKDVLQDAFLKIFDSIGQYSRKGSLRAWMTRIVINQALNLYQFRNRQVMENYDDYEDGLMDKSVIEPDMLTHEILLGFIQDLSDGYRMVFNLCEIEGYSHDEIAKMMGCSASTCRSQLFKAKNILRKRIEEFNKNEKQLQNERI